MYVGAIRAEFTIPASCSLKSKRKPLRSIIDRLKNNFKCSASEVAYQDKWQRTSIGIAVVSGEEKVLRKQMEDIKQFLTTNSEMMLISIHERIFDKMENEDYFCEDRDDTPPEDLLFMN